MGQDFVSKNDQSLDCHPKVERAEAEKAKDRLKNREPIYPSKGVFQPPIAHKATLGDKAAHSHDSVQLCPKILPVDRQEFRGCKRREMDLPTKRWNKDVYLDSFPEGGACDVRNIQEAAAIVVPQGYIVEAIQGQLKMVSGIWMREIESALLHVTLFCASAWTCLGISVKWYGQGN
ncbi:hypothetical protein KVR01_009650 [Diaporthe batatas]|uniref:uncharacterized protein n=1 Tax=Diaporthe batatas TaxID=748121 RepID=UPI001D05B3D7|nr:uncharacterized protein KVR01_009650 [Diaporthe batatas]KAG8160114.1 hypothetical protein KVR01_009650 [Diaporthe batatas]